MMFYRIHQSPNTLTCPREIRSELLELLLHLVFDGLGEHVLDAVLASFLKWFATLEKQFDLLEPFFTGRELISLVLERRLSLHGPFLKGDSLALLQGGELGMTHTHTWEHS